MAKRTKRTTKISRETADRFSQTLENLPAKAKTKLTPKELIFENFHQLTAALEKGYDYDDLIGMLAAENVKLSAATLRQYLSEARRAGTGEHSEVTQASVPENKATQSKDDSPQDRPRQRTSNLAPTTTERAPDKSPANVTQKHPENASPEPAPQGSKPHLPSASKFDFDDDPELVEMVDVL
ncbi:MAG: hypothetical protein AAGE59_13325 [Cyanobacteria bacterium P01_F01_bin.86]